MTTQTSFACETAAMIHMIPVGMIHTAPQVRTKFNEATINELAGDIAKRGVMQPVTVTPRGEGFKLVIGERRLRAIRHNGAPFVPAFIAHVSDDDCEDLQLAENIQREDLSAKDVAGSIEKLWKKHGSVLAVAKICHKSKSWVSKRLALALKVGPLTAELLDASLKDIELIYLFTTLEKADEVAARELLPQLIEKSAGRREVKAAIAAALTSSEDDEGNDDIDTTMDLFDEPETTPTPPAAEHRDTKALKLAMTALIAIVSTQKTDSFMAKWERARNTANAALEAIATMPEYGHGFWPR